MSEVMNSPMNYQILCILIILSVFIKRRHHVINPLQVIAISILYLKIKVSKILISLIIKLMYLVFILCYIIMSNY